MPLSSAEPFFEEQAMRPLLWRMFGWLDETVA